MYKPDLYNKNIGEKIQEIHIPINLNVQYKEYSNPTRMSSKTSLWICNLLSSNYKSYLETIVVESDDCLV